MKSINVEIMMGHDVGLSESYYRPTQLEVMEDYLKAATLLTINVQSKDNEYIMRGKLAEKDNRSNF